MSDARQRLAARIRALLAKTTARGCTEDEAMAAAAKAVELMQAHGLELTDVEAAAEPLGFAGHSTGYRRQRHLVCRLEPAISALTGCRGFVDLGTTPISIRYFGRAHEGQIAVYLTKVAQGALDRGMREFRAAQAGRRVKGARLARQVRQFGIGMADRIAMTLRQMARGLRSAQVSDGRSLVAVRSALVDKAWAEQGIKLKSITIGKVDRRHNRSRDAGWRKGGDVHFDPGLADRGERRAALPAPGDRR